MSQNMDQSKSRAAHISCVYLLGRAINPWLTSTMRSIASLFATLPGPVMWLTSQSQASVWSGRTNVDTVCCKDRKNVQSCHAHSTSRVSGSAKPTGPVQHTVVQNVICNPEHEIYCRLQLTATHAARLSHLTRFSVHGMLTTKIIKLSCFSVKILNK